MGIPLGITNVSFTPIPRYNSAYGLGTPSLYKFSTRDKVFFTFQQEQCSLQIRFETQCRKQINKRQKLDKWINK